MATELEISTSAAHRIAVTLLSEGLLHQEPSSRKYSLEQGVTVSVVDGELDRCLAIAPEFLTALRDENNETVHLGILSGARVTFKLGYESHAELRITNRVGRSAPLHTAAAGKVLLARLQDDEIRRLLEGHPLEARTERSIRSITALLAEVDEVRRRGFATNIAETEDGVYTLAVPLRGAANTVIAAIAVSAPLMRMGKLNEEHGTLSRQPGLLRQALACAEQIRELLVLNGRGR